MTELTIFSTPKPFIDEHITLIQRNAIQSWMSLGDDVRVILVGDEQGMDGVAREFGLIHIREVAANQKGTPLVSSIFLEAERSSETPLLAYVNADILLMPDFLESARTVNSLCNEFLVVGQRWDLDIDRPLHFSSDWVPSLRHEARQRGEMHRPAGSDFFIFPRGLFDHIPDFAIGRAGWDNWMIYYGVSQPWPVIDATSSIMTVHQNHDYAHLPGGRAHYKLDETFENAGLGGGMANMYMILDTDKELRSGRIQRPRFRLARLIRRLERRVFPPDGRQHGPRWGLTRRLRRLRRRFA